MLIGLDIGSIIDYMETIIRPNHFCMFCGAVLEKKKSGVLFEQHTGKRYDVGYYTCPNFRWWHVFTFTYHTLRMVHLEETNEANGKVG